MLIIMFHEILAVFCSSITSLFLSHFLVATAFFFFDQWNWDKSPCLHDCPAASPCTTAEARDITSLFPFSSPLSGAWSSPSRTPCSPSTGIVSSPATPSPLGSGGLPLRYASRWQQAIGALGITGFPCCRPCGHFRESVVESPRPTTATTISSSLLQLCHTFGPPLQDDLLTATLPGFVPAPGSLNRTVAGPLAN